MDQLETDAGGEGGFQVAVWVQSCALTVSGPSKGKPEVDIFKIIQGKEKDVMVMIGFRYQPTPDQIA